MTGRLLPHGRRTRPGLTATFRVDPGPCKDTKRRSQQPLRQLPGRYIRDAKRLMPVPAVRCTAQKPLSPSVYQMSLCVGSYAGADVANEPAFLLVWLGSTGLLKYATSPGCAGLRMSNTRSPDMMNEQATMVGLIRLGVEQ